VKSIVIISSSIRTHRESHRAALFFKKFITENNLASAEIIDLLELDFPLFHERLSHQTNPLPSALEFARKIKQADGVIIVTPEYNGGYPASLKNATDLLYNKWYKKPVGIVTVSDGVFGGTQVLTALQFSLWKMWAWTIPAMFPVPKVKETFHEDGTAADSATETRANAFLKELAWCMEAVAKMKTT
jgi:NAD(P)H-dependent FMN reductase